MNMIRGIKCEEGNTYGHLRVCSMSGFNSNGVTWLCQCLKCHRTVVVYGGRLRSGAVTDCGCSKDDLYYSKIRNLRSPCEKGCSFFDFCQKKKLACSLFDDFVKWGLDSDPKPEIHQPTKALYRRIFKKWSTQEVRDK